MIDFFKQFSVTNIVGALAGILTSVSALPQLVKTFKKKESEEISVFMIGLLMAGVGTWFFYGILKSDYPIIFTNAFSFLVNLILLVLYFKYKK